MRELFVHLRTGEQRPATILMTDISGFTSMGEAVTAEHLFNLLNDLFGELVECLLDYGAHIDKYMGDEIMALFGVPVAQERSAERAVLAALAMRDRMVALSAEGRFGDTTLSLHTGINIGPVMVGPVGHQSRVDYTVIGDAVNVAKRLEDEAPEGEIYVSEAVRSVLDEGFVLEAVGPLRLKGRRQPVSVYRVVSAPLQMTRLGARCAGGVPLKARDAQLAELTDRAAASSRGAQECVGVVGPVGIGKSSLLSEWLLSAGREQFLVLETGCFPYADHFPYLPIADLFAQLVGLRIAGWPPRMVGDVLGCPQGGDLSEDARRSIGWLKEQLEGAAPDAGLESPEAVCEGLSQALRAASRERSICLVLDDVQWLDDPSRELLLGLLSRAADQPLYVLFTCRDPLPEWVAGLERTDRVALSPLPQPVICELITAWAAPLPLAGDTVLTIAEKAQGNPFLARELVHALRGVADADRAASSLPNSLHELFLAQLDHMALPLRRLVQAASIVGEPLSRSLLEAAMGDAPLGDDLLRRALDEHLLQPGAYPEQLVFGRRLLFEAAYETIPLSQRQALHARLADHLLAQLDGDDEAVLHAAAHHAYIGYHDQRAIDVLLRSARRYWAQYASRQTIRAGQQVNELVSDAGGATDLTDHRVEALLLMAQAYQVLGDLDRAGAALAEAGALAPDCGDEALAARVATSSATLSWMMGDLVEAREQFGRARAWWLRLGDATRVAQALVGEGLSAQAQGDRAAAHALFLEAARGDGREAWVRAAALNNAGMLLLEDGCCEEAAQYIRHGLAANEEADDQRGIAHSSCSLGEALYHMGRHSEALEHLCRALALAQQMGDAQCTLLASAYLARTHAASGDLAAAQQDLSGLDVSACADDAELDAVLRQAREEAGMA